MKFNEERGSNYKKFKSLNEIELQNLKEIWKDKINFDNLF
jgi:hypothetical protein